MDLKEMEILGRDQLYISNYKSMTYTLPLVPHGLCVGTIPQTPALDETFYMSLENIF